VKKNAFRIACVFVAIFAVWFSFNLHTYIRRRLDAHESARQAEIMREIFSVEDMRFATRNDEIVARIFVPGTAINYIVVHGKDNEFYLSHDMFREPNENGSIFLDYANDPCFTNRNTIIYGHNRDNGTKFHDLQLFQNGEFFNDNSTIFITTQENLLQYEIFAVFTAHMTFNYIQVDFPDDDAFLSLMNEIKDRAMHSREIEISACDRVLILSTCTNIGPTGRLVVVGRLINGM